MKLWDPVILSPLSSLPSYIIIYTGLLCIVGFALGVHASVFFGGITTIEKAFQFSSTQMGLSNAMFVVGYAGLCV